MSERERRLEGENEKLRREVSWLQGRVEDLEKQAARRESYLESLLSDYRSMQRGGAS